MSDKYLEVANSSLGKKLFSAVGLPDPVSYTHLTLPTILLV